MGVLQEQNGIVVQRVLQKQIPLSESFRTGRTTVANSCLTCLF